MSRTLGQSGGTLMESSDAKTFHSLGAHAHIALINQVPKGRAVPRSVALYEGAITMQRHNGGGVEHDEACAQDGKGLPPDIEAHGAKHFNRLKSAIRAGDRASKLELLHMPQRVRDEDGEVHIRDLQVIDELRDS